MTRHTRTSSQPPGLFARWWGKLTGNPGKRSDHYAGAYGHGAGGGFSGAAINRLTASMAAWSGALNADLDGSLVILRARARSLAANLPRDDAQGFLGEQPPLA